jgi:hypothetical protein
MVGAFVAALRYSRASGEQWFCSPASTTMLREHLREF